MSVASSPLVRRKYMLCPSIMSPCACKKMAGYCTLHPITQRQSTCQVEVIAEASQARPSTAPLALANNYRSLIFHSAIRRLHEGVTEIFRYRNNYLWGFSPLPDKTRGGYEFSFLKKEAFGIFASTPLFLSNLLCTQTCHCLASIPRGRRPPLMGEISSEECNEWGWHEATWPFPSPSSNGRNGLPVLVAFARL